MTWAHTVWHVLRKDVRHQRLAIAAYVALIAFATVWASRDSATSWLPEGILLALAALALGMLIIAPAVQSDAPDSERAHWRALPLAPSAVAAAKVAFVGGLLAVGMLGQVACAQRFDVSVSDTVRLVLASLPTTLLVFASAAMLASVVPGVKGFVVAVLGTPVAALILNEILPSGLTRGGLLYRLSFGMVRLTENDVVVAVACLCLLALIYARRLTHRRAWAATAVMMLCMVNALTHGSGDRRRVPLTRSNQEYRASSVSFAFDTTTPQRPWLLLAVNGGNTSDEHRVLLDSGAVILKFPDSTERRVPLDLPGFLVTSRVSSNSSTSAEISGGAEEFNSGHGIPIQDPAHVPTDGSTASSTRWPATFGSAHALRLEFLTDDQRRALMSGAVTARIDGSGRQLTPVVAMRAPAALGTQQRQRGMRLAILRASNERTADARTSDSSARRSQVWPRLVVRSLEHRDGPDLSRMLDRSEALVAFAVDTSRSVAWRLSEDLAHSGSDMLVLPGPSIDRSAYILAPVKGDFVRGNADASAVDDRTVVVVGWTGRTIVRIRTDPLPVVAGTRP
jgi:hypothetical protein